MAIGLENNPNISPPTVDYPKGNIKDDSGAGDGTPLNKLVHADFHQFFSKLLTDAGMSANGLPDNTTNTFQYALALAYLIQTNYNVGFINTGLVYAAPAVHGNNYGSIGGAVDLKYKRVNTSVIFKGHIGVVGGAGSGVIVIGEVMVTLPVSIRPSRQISISVAYGNPNPLVVEGWLVMTIDTNGEVKFYQAQRAINDDSDFTEIPMEFIYEI